MSAINKEFRRTWQTNKPKIKITPIFFCFKYKQGHVTQHISTLHKLIEHDNCDWLRDFFKWSKTTNQKMKKFIFFKKLFKLIWEEYISFFFYYNERLTLLRTDKKEISNHGLFFLDSAKKTLNKNIHLIKKIFSAKMCPIWLTSVK